MSVWLVEPLDPLIARDGRPASVGGHFFTVSSPYPSMLAGAVRTRMGCEDGAFTLRGDALRELLEKVIVRGPLLAEMQPEGDEILQWLAPAPRDQTILRTPEGATILKRHVPHRLDPEEAAMDSLGEAGLLPAGYRGGDSHGKPPKDLPAFWRWAEFESWLTAPADRPAVDLKPGDRIPADRDPRPSRDAAGRAGRHGRHVLSDLRPSLPPGGDPRA